jgi:hypothetical protein
MWAVPLPKNEKFGASSDDSFIEESLYFKRFKWQALEEKRKRHQN